MTLTVILNRVKYPHNLAAAIRACACFGVDRLYYSGKRFEFTDGERLPREERMKGYTSVTWEPSERPFDKLYPSTNIFCVELTPSARSLSTIDWLAEEILTPHLAFVFGPEDGHVSQAYRTHCHQFIYIPSRHCLNLSAAINVVLASRIMALGEDYRPAITENRGIIEVPGWEGR